MEQLSEYSEKQLDKWWKGFNHLQKQKIFNLMCMVSECKKYKW